MKAVILALVLVAGSFAANQDALRPVWEQWKVQYGASYEDSNEEAYRFSVFMNNYNAIHEWNARPDVTSTQGVNKFANLTNQEFGALFTGSYEAPVDQSKIQTEFEGSCDVSGSFDWRDENKVTPVKNQEQCGSCWAFATVATIESLYLLNGNEQKLFSEQQIVDCDTKAYGCEGGLASLGIQYVQANGLETESDYPYKAVDEKCNYQSSEATKDLAGGYFAVESVNNANKLKEAICQQPIAVAVEADQNAFQFYNGGVISSGCGTKLDHAITAVGFGKAQGSDAFYIKNSWGSDWGVDGYVYISTDDTINKGTGACGVLSQPVGPKSAN